ncbi:hypothetical protein QUF80_20840 [Desulfococcaceae bacterium HSG8]|nr:hypothetical protein [Desulfococcaceae bacterium HSG8]
MYGDIPKPIVKKGLRPSTRATSKTGVRKNLDWLKRNHHKYQGQWVALNEGIFLNASESFVELRRTLKNAGQLDIALFVNLKTDM